MQDDLIKYTIFDAIASFDAETVAGSFLKPFFSRLEIPDFIITDQGSNFTSQLLKDLCKVLKVKKIVTTPYYSQTNGALERVPATLGQYLRSIITTRTNWDDWIDFAMFSYNTLILSKENYNYHIRLVSETF